MPWFDKPDIGIFLFDPAYGCRLIVYIGTGEVSFTGLHFLDQAIAKKNFLFWEKTDDIVCGVPFTKKLIDDLLISKHQFLQAFKPCFGNGFAILFSQYDGLDCLHKT